MTEPDYDVMVALCQQVQQAAQGGDERDVVTIITRSMWHKYRRGAQGCYVGCVPSYCCTVYGSATHIVDRAGYEAVSYRREDL